MKPKSIRAMLWAPLAAMVICAGGPSVWAADIYVTENGSDINSQGLIGHYTTSGGTVNASLVTGLTAPYALAVAGGNIYVTNLEAGTVSEYTTSGVLESASFVTGLSGPDGIAVSGGDLFVVNEGRDSIGEYDATTGATINASLVTKLNQPFGITVSGGDIFVANNGNGTIGEYTTSGAVVNAFLINGIGVDQPTGVTVAGNHLFVSAFGPMDTSGQGKIGEYRLDGSTINAQLVTGLNSPESIASYGNDLFVTLSSRGIGEYTTSGDVVNALLINTLGNLPFGIAVVPEPATWVMLAIGAAALLVCGRKRWS